MRFETKTNSDTKSDSILNALKLWFQHLNFDIASQDEDWRCLNVHLMLNKGVWMQTLTISSSLTATESWKRHEIKSDYHFNGAWVDIIMKLWWRFVYYIGMSKYIDGLIYFDPFKVYFEQPHSTRKISPWPCFINSLARCKRWLMKRAQVWPFHTGQCEQNTAGSL